MSTATTPRDGPSPEDATPASSGQQPSSGPFVTLQPLPRGRPPRPKQPGPLPGSWKPDNSQEWDEYANAALPDTQQHSTQQRQQPQSKRSKKSALDLAYTRGGHLLGGYNAARYPGISATHAAFSREGKLIHLTGPNNINAWTEQITYIARALSCFDELTKRFTTFPNPSSVQLFICETRHATAFRVLEASISGPVWAYMRVLGYSTISGGDGLLSPAPVDCFDYARMAASKMLIPGTPEQPVNERKRMVQEILNAESTEYPSERSYKKGLDWLRLACDNLIRQGDYWLAAELYDPVPDWAPKPAGAGHIESISSTAIPEKDDPAGSLDRNGAEATLGASGLATPSNEAVDSPVDDESAGKPLTHQNSSTPNLTTEDANPQSTKRKRSSDDVGPEQERPSHGAPDKS